MWDIYIYLFYYFGSENNDTSKTNLSLKLFQN